MGGELIPDQGKELGVVSGGTDCEEYTRCLEVNLFIDTLNNFLKKLWIFSSSQKLLDEFVFG